jgi:hypothetical protein
LESERATAPAALGDEALTVLQQIRDRVIPELARLRATQQSCARDGDFLTRLAGLVAPLMLALRKRGVSLVSLDDSGEARDRLRADAVELLVSPLLTMVHKISTSGAGRRRGAADAAPMAAGHDHSVRLQLASAAACIASMPTSHDSGGSRTLRLRAARAALTLRHAPDLDVVGRSMDIAVMALSSSTDAAVAAAAEAAAEAEGEAEAVAGMALDVIAGSARFWPLLSWANLAQIWTFAAGAPPLLRNDGEAAPSAQQAFLALVACRAKGLVRGSSLGHRTISLLAQASSTQPATCRTLLLGEPAASEELLRQSVLQLAAMARFRPILGVEAALTSLGPHMFATADDRVDPSLASILCQALTSTPAAGPLLAPLVCERYLVQCRLLTSDRQELANFVQALRRWPTDRRVLHAVWAVCRGHAGVKRELVRAGAFDAAFACLGRDPSVDDAVLRLLRNFAITGVEAQTRAALSELRRLRPEAAETLAVLEDVLRFERATASGTATVAPASGRIRVASNRRPPARVWLPTAVAFTRKR